MFVCISRRRPLDERYKKLIKEYKPPKNVERMQVPDTNKDVWELLKRGAQIVDSKTQTAQHLIIATLSVMAKLNDKIASGTAGTCSDHDVELSDVVTMLVMGQSYLNQVRKELVRNALGYPIAKFCTWDTPAGPSQLFDDLPKKLKEREESYLKLRRGNRYR